MRQEHPTAAAEAPSPPSRLNGGGIDGLVGAVRPATNKKPPPTAICRHQERPRPLRLLARHRRQGGCPRNRAEPLNDCSRQPRVGDSGKATASDRRCRKGQTSCRCRRAGMLAKGKSADTPSVRTDPPAVNGRPTPHHHGQRGGGEQTRGGRGRAEAAAATPGAAPSWGRQRPAQQRQWRRWRRRAEWRRQDSRPCNSSVSGSDAITDADNGRRACTPGGHGLMKVTPVVEQWPGNGRRSAERDGRGGRQLGGRGGDACRQVADWAGASKGYVLYRQPLAGPGISNPPWSGGRTIMGHPSRWPPLPTDGAPPALDTDKGPRPPHGPPK